MIAIGTAGLTFDEPTHTYRLDGIEIPSVTAVIADNRLGGDFSHVHAADLERARNLGRAVHAALHYADADELDESTVADVVWPYLEAWTAFKMDHAVTVVEMERCLADGSLRFGGTLDREVLVGRDRQSVLVDVKTGSIEGAAYQTAAYAYLAGLGPHTQRWAVALHPDRGVPYSIHPFRDLRDWRIFRAALQPRRRIDARTGPLGQTLEDNVIPDDFDDEPVEEVRMTIVVGPDPNDMTSDEQLLKLSAQHMVAQAMAVAVVDVDSYRLAGAMLDELKMKKRDVLDWFEPMVSAANKAWKALTSKRASVIDPLDEAIAILSSRYATFAQEERRRAEAERRRLEREAQERERARLQAEADARAKEAADALAAAARSTSTAESDALTRQAEQLSLEAEAVRVEAAEVQAPVIAVRSRIAEAGGPTVAASWTFEVTDKALLVAAVAAGTVSIEAVEPSDTYLGQFARANKGTRPIPGVRFFDQGSVRASRRR